MAASPINSASSQSSLSSEIRFITVDDLFNEIDQTNGHILTVYGM